MWKLCTKNQKRCRKHGVALLSFYKDQTMDVHVPILIINIIIHILLCNSCTMVFYGAYAIGYSRGIIPLYHTKGTTYTPYKTIIHYDATNQTL